MNRETIYILSDSIAVCHLPDGSEREVTIQRPNDPRRPYQVQRRRLQIQNDYRDPNFNPQRGYNKFELEFILSWDHHLMNLDPLLVSERIDMKVPVYLYKDSRYYKEFSVTLQNTEFTEAKYQGIHVARHESDLKTANVVPNQGEQLRFITDSMNWDEYLEALGWFQPITLVGDDGQPLHGFVAGEDLDDDSVEAVALDPAVFGAENNETFNLQGIEYQINFIEMETMHE